MLLNKIKFWKYSSYWIKVFIAFENINITLDKNKTKEAKRQNCTENFLQLYDGSTSVKDQRLHFCQSEINKFYKSQTNKIFLRYNQVKNSENDIFLFRIVFNPYTTGSFW